MPRLFVLLAALCFGTTGTAQALGPSGASPVTVGEARIIIGALGLQLAAAWAGRRTPLAPPGSSTPPGTAARRRPRIAVPRGRWDWLAAAGVAGYQVTFFLAVRTTGVAVGTVVALGSAPVITGALGMLCRQGRPGGRWVIATALAAVGLGVLTLAGGPARVEPVGVLLALLSGTGYAVYTVAAKRAMHGGERGERVMAAYFTGGAVLLLPVFVLFPVGWLATTEGLLTALWLGVVPTTTAYLLFARGLRGVSAAEASTLTLAEPLTAAALGVLALGERPAEGAVVGALLLLAGLVVLGTDRPGRRWKAGRGPVTEPGVARVAR
jgi:DME family drug/metabolite transporter